MVIALLPVTSVVASLSPPTLLSATSVSSTSSLALATSSAIALTTEVEAIVVAPVLVRVESSIDTEALESAMIKRSADGGLALSGLAPVSVNAVPVPAETYLLS